VNIVSSKGRDQEQIFYKSSQNPIRPLVNVQVKDSVELLPIPVAVLVNSGTASASEIVSGALQDYDAAVIIGPSRTFGKGLVQKIVPLPGNAALKFTSSKYYTPSGRCIQAVDYRGGRSVGPENGEDGNAVKLLLADRTASGVTIPESKRQEFRTQHGRIVKDGGGVEPDVTVAPLELGPAETILVSRNSFFKFATEYLGKHPDLVVRLNEQADRIALDRRSVLHT
jgi:carboxyl-terminal processing protease